RTPQPDGKTMYLVYLPDGAHIASNPAGVCFPNGYHNTFGMMGDQFGVVMGCTGGFFESRLQAMTIVGSHEVIEAATDPKNGYYLAAAHPQRPWLDSPWIHLEADTFVENADMCIGTRVREGDFFYQRNLSNIGAARGEDPCAPGLSMAYYSVTTDQDWFEG